MVPGSASRSRVGCARHTSSGRSRTPDAPVATAMRHPSRAPASEGSSLTATGSHATSNRSETRSAADFARSNARELRRTAAPARPRSPAIRWPTGPVPASTTADSPASGASSPLPRPASMSATAAAAVVFAPFESSITDTRNPPKKCRRTAASSASPAARSLPPMNRAEFFLCAGPRV